ncbi:MAG: PadR family transcriptional regulator [Promethearchaeota archaeon]|nr:MAG: PadR family transcriptional regulator [Candidatus Lokiarchaeota archaeon]
MTTQEEESLLNHSKFIVLGLIAEEPSHAYQLNEKIEERGMRDWTSIGKSSIYRVIKDLEENGYADRWIEEVDNRVIKIYQITEKGLNVLKNHVFNILKNYYAKSDEDFYVAFSMLPMLNKKEKVKAISNSIEKIKNHIKELKEKLKENRNMPLNVTGLFIHPIEVLKTNKKFLEWVLEEVRKVKGSAIPRDYKKEMEMEKTE